LKLLPNLSADFNTNKNQIIRKAKPSGGAKTARKATLATSCLAGPVEATINLPYDLRLEYRLSKPNKRLNPSVSLTGTG
tara:strand:- start:248 stop:484 length:237 start_codon:yes stop_codon:yes gene_type:complete